MRHHKDKHRRALHRLPDVRDSHDVLPQRHPGEILPVLVLLIDDLGQLLALEL